MTLNFRQYEADDFDSIVPLYQDVFARPPWNETWQREWVVDRIQWLLDMPTFQGFVLETEQSIVGVVLGYGAPHKGKRVYEIVEFFVAPSHQRQGIGKRLINELRNQLPAEQGWELFELLSKKDSEPEQFYRAVGFRRLDQMAILILDLS